MAKKSRYMAYVNAAKKRIDSKGVKTSLLSKLKEKKGGK